jgi:hypothetical protein
MQPGGFRCYCACLKGPAGHLPVTAAPATVHAAFPACTDLRKRLGGRDSHICDPPEAGDASNLAIFLVGHCEDG